MAFDYPADLKYTDTHEYVRLEGDAATVGITAFAIDQLGDIVFLELPAVGETVEKGEKFGTIESVKAVEDLKSPISGTIVECNTSLSLIDTPEAIGDDSYGEGWLLKVQVVDLGSVDDLIPSDVIVNWSRVLKSIGYNRLGCNRFWFNKLNVSS
jgi:glycine cleavage system H protein